MNKITKKVVADTSKNISTITTVKFGTDDNYIEVDFDFNKSLAEYFSFVNYVVNACFDEDGEYCPERFDSVFTSALFTTYSNFPMPETKNEDGTKSFDLEAFERYNNKFNFLDVIENEMCEKIYCYETVCHDKIEELKKKYQKKSSTDILCDTLIELAKQFEDKLSKIDMEELSNGFKNINSMVESSKEQKSK